ncbi:MAG: hypothetical protein SOW46_09650 [Candidatus Aphodomonas sp.]|nr:hypothetical protein [Candidatus Aphodomonas sp.]
MKKKIALLAAVLLALFVSAMAFNLQRGVTVGETFLPKRSDALYQKNADYRVSLSHDGDKTLCDIRFGAETLSAALIWNGERVRIEYDDGTVVAGVWYPAEKWVMDEEGMPVIWSDGATVIVNGETVSIGRGALANALCRMDTNAAEPRGSAALPLTGALLYALGAAALLWPEQTFFFANRWRYNVPELSEEGAAAQRLGGVAMMAVSAFVMFAPLIL